MIETLSPGIVLEAALLASPRPLKVPELQRLFAGSLSGNRVREELGRLAASWGGRGMRLTELADGWCFITTADMAPYIARLGEEKTARYSRAVMETLAIIAYRQPATRGDIEEIRGVAVNPGVIRQLQERGWIQVVGRRETPGRPEMFGTTSRFLDDLALRSLADLPLPDGVREAGQEFQLNLPVVPEDVDGQQPPPHA